MSAHGEFRRPAAAEALPSTFHVDVRSLPGGTRLLTLKGEIDLSCLAGFQAVLDDELTDTSRTVVVDLTQLDFLAAGGAGVLSAAAHRAAADRVDLHVAGAQRMVRRVLELTGLTARLPCHDSLSEALRLLS